MDAASDEPGISRALTALRSLLIPGEELETHAIQRRLFALTHRRTIVGATSGRLIVVARGLFGDYTPQDVRWQDLQDAQLRVGVFGATLIGERAWHRRSRHCRGSAPRRCASTASGRTRHSEVYRACQSQEQAWREKRRVRELEELRAKSGGINLAGGTGMAPASAGDDGVAGARRAPPARQGHAAAGPPHRRRVRAGEGADPLRAVALTLAELVETSRARRRHARPPRQDRPPRRPARVRASPTRSLSPRRTSAASFPRTSSASDGPALQAAAAATIPYRPSARTRRRRSTWASWTPPSGGSRARRARDPRRPSSGSCASCSRGSAKTSGVSCSGSSPASCARARSKGS